MNTEIEKFADYLIECKNCSMHEQCICEESADECEIRKQSYNKALDDFVKEICKMIVQSENNGNYRFYAVEIKQAIVDLAEQLKAGRTNGL